MDFMKYIQEINPIIFVGLAILIAFILLKKILKKIVKIIFLTAAILTITGGSISTFNLKNYTDSIVPNVQDSINSYAEQNGINLANVSESQLANINTYLQTNYPGIQIKNDNGNLSLEVSKGDFLNFKTSVTLQTNK